MTDFYSSTPDAQAEALTRLARAALPIWGVSPNARVDLIKHRENAVFSVTDAAQRYALRVHRAHYHTDAELASELQWIAALDGAGLRTPQVLTSAAGASFERVAVDEVPEARQVDLLEWFDGTPIGGIEGPLNEEDLATVFADVGRLMAITHTHGARWERPDGFTRHAWDESGILGEQPFWGRYQDLESLTSTQLELLGEARAKALVELEAFGKGDDRYGLIHADFLPENLLRRGDEVCLIDFDDAGFGWHLFDVATSLFFHMGEESFDPAMAALIAGYRQERSMPDAHLAHLPLFFLLRGFTYLGWAHTRRETETARELTPMVVSAVEALAQDYLS